MKRREFIAGMGMSGVLPLTSRAQGRVRRIGVLMASGNDSEGQRRLVAFQESLQKLGWEQGRIEFDTRWAAADMEEMRRFAKDLVVWPSDLILSTTTPSTELLAKETRDIPILFTIVSDPVGSGFVASFSRPGGNITGFTNIEPAMAGKWVELLKEIAPHVSRVAVVFNPTMATYAEYYLNSFKAAAASFGLQPTLAPVRDMSELEAAILAQADAPNGSLVVMTDTFTSAYRAEITSLAAKGRLPAVYPYRFFAEAGGLLSYGNDLIDNFRRAAEYADRILRGARPSDLPVQAPAKFELVINLKTAKILSLTVPPTLLARADEVIE